MLECLARDRTKHQVAEVTSLGLVQMTRKRVGSGLLEAFSVTCECCNGRGVHVSLEPAEESPSAPPRHRGDERSGTDAAKTPAAQAEDKPAGSSSSSRRRRRKTPSPVGNGSAAEAVAAIASASSEAGQDGAVSSNGHSGSAHAPEPSAAAAAAEG
jgi:ribonuclease E